MTITVIDDDESTAELYEAYLTEIGFENIESYTDSRPFKSVEFVEQVVAKSRLIICDIRMPYVDGREIMDKVIDARKKLGVYPVFIFISGIPIDYYPCTEDGWGALTKADHVIVKPVNMSEFSHILSIHGIFPPIDPNNFDEKSA